MQEEDETTQWPHSFGLNIPPATVAAPIWDARGGTSSVTKLTTGHAYLPVSTNMLMVNSGEWALSLSGLCGDGLPLVRPTCVLQTTPSCRHHDPPHSFGPDRNRVW